MTKSKKWSAVIPMVSLNSLLYTLYHLYLLPFNTPDLLGGKRSQFPILPFSAKPLEGIWFQEEVTLPKMWVLKGSITKPALTRVRSKLDLFFYSVVHLFSIVVLTKGFWSIWVAYRSMQSVMFVRPAGWSLLAIASPFVCLAWWKC